MDASVLVVSLYFGALVGGFAIVGAWETLAPARPARAPLRERWTANLGLLALNHGILPILLPVSNGAAAWFATERGWGFMNVVALPPAAAFALTLVALDAGGLITIRCGGTSAQTDFIVDILGFTL